MFPTRVDSFSPNLPQPNGDGSISSSDLENKVEAEDKSTHQASTAAESDPFSHQSGIVPPILNHTVQRREQDPDQNDVLLALLLKQVEGFPQPFDPVRVVVDFPFPARSSKKTRETDS